jgi:dTDP-glucose 4,6-dehydratase
LSRHLISGGAGFIGSHLCDRLLGEGHEVVALDNLITGSRKNVKHLANHPRFKFVKGDATKPIRLPGKFHQVWHLASLASPRHYLAHPIHTLETGSSATRNMLDVAHKHGARFLVTSTSECYGDPLEHPQKETYWGNVNPIGERSCYDESKRFAEAMTMAYHRKFGVSTSIARIFNTYGPRMALDDGRVVPAFLDQALHGRPLTVFGRGQQTRSFCFVSDMVDGLVRLAASDEHLPVNLGNPVEMTIMEFATRIQSLMGTRLPIEYKPMPSDDPRQRRPDISKAKRILKWKPQVKLADGLRETVEYFKSDLKIQ